MQFFNRNLLVRKKNKLNKLPNGFILFCLIPSCILTILFIIIPTFQALLLSFQQVGSVSLKGEWIWFDNYRYLFEDEGFLKSFENTIKLVLIVPIFSVGVSVILAFILQEVKLREKQMYVTVFYLPSIISATILTVIWSYVFHPTVGIVNQILEKTGLESWKHVWLGESETALWCIAVVIFISSFGYYMILNMVGMAGISPEIYESAEIDGAGMWTKFWKITFPLMKNLIGINIVLSMSGVLSSSFAYSKLLTNGGPNNASMVLMFYGFKQGIMNGNMGYSSVISVVTIIVAFVLSTISRKISNEEV